MERRENKNLSLSGIQFKMCQQLIRKIKKAGAISKETAVTIEGADLDFSEYCWLPYFAGTFLGRIKKTEDHRYYL